MIGRTIKLLNVIGEKFFIRLTFYNLKKLEQKSKLAVFDLDNTVVDTGAELIKIGSYPGFISYFSIYRWSKPIVNMANLISHLRTRKVTIVFLSARSFPYYWVTKEWIQINLGIKNPNVILVDNAKDKIKILKLFSKYSVLYYDDLTYGHESGSIVKYVSVINEIAKLDINYFDDNFIQSVRGNDMLLIDHLNLFYEPEIK